MKRTKDEDKEEAPAQPAAHNSSAGSNGHEATSPVATNAPATATTSSAAVLDASLTGSSVRTTGRVKKPKQVYDPSDNYVSRASSNRNSLGGAAGSLAAAAANAQSPPASATAKEASDSQDSTPSPAVSEQQQQQAAQNRNFDTCQKCAKSEPKRGSGHKSNFLTCKGCMQKWHFPCLPVHFQNQSMARKKYKCEKCRYCQVCNVRGRDLAICSSCVEAYHADCNDPTIKQSKSVDTNPKWKCFRCEASGNSGNNTSPSSEEQAGGRKSNASREEQPAVPRKSNAGRKKRVQSDPTGQEKPAKIEKLGKRSPPLKTDEKREKREEKKESKEEKKEELLEQPAEVKVEKVEKQEEIEPVPENKNQPEPNQEAEPSRLSPPPPAAAGSPVDIKCQPVSTWSVEQVVGFVAKHYPKEANVFRYQDIDGASLLLLTRQDVMNGFGLKLGPALRVFELVMSLQSRSDDVRLAWFE
ncbi:neurofilament heavy polypeptide isoform X1 [Drosophila takahashii]|uniref:neurofilament heavy polypeptide isoform X1 n=2 Tax=Drosophila takahashii TaxID=29030 RepID=UPI001CF85A7C|nr:histone-lysine N-methyltransferase 2D [Drosophila takahashii]